MCLGPLDHDRTARKEGEGENLPARVPVSCSGEAAHWWLTPAMIWGFPGREKLTTGCRESRRARVRGQRRRSLPAMARGGGWRRAARRCASGLGIGVDLLQNK
jgi:hypothetical protein